jgi:hypothetical protein
VGIAYGRTPDNVIPQEEVVRCGPGFFGGKLSEKTIGKFAQIKMRNILQRDFAPFDH